MAAEQRSLRRVNNKYGSEIRAEIVCPGMIYPADVADYNSLGVSLDIANCNLQRTDNILSIKIYYGSELICKVKNPRTITFLREQNRMVLALESERLQSHFVRRERAELSFSMQGSVFGRDPFTLDQMLSFRLLNISVEGFSLISSKSNRHLMPGLNLHDFTIMLPGYNMVKVSFQIRNVVDTGSHLKLGCFFLKIDKGFQSEIERILLTNSNLAVAGEIVDKNLKSRIKRIKKFGSWIRIRRVTNREEFEQVLKIRFSAYQEANKVKAGQTWKDMEDEYDKNSITYAAFAGLTIAGTIRLVIREPNTRLPFEEYISWEKVTKFDPRSSAEVSRFAIDPHFQGTDLFFALFRKIIFEIGAKKIRSPVCLATKKLSKYYTGIGAVSISEPIPHPTIEDETLTLYLFDPEAIAAGKMSALGWLYVAKPALKLLWKFKFVKKPNNGILKYLFAIPEFLKLYLQKLLRLT